MADLAVVLVWWVGKLLQALGLIVVAAGFLMRFPELMSPRVLFLGIGFFVSGYLIERACRCLKRM